MKFFLSCDWGTTTLRVRLVRPGNCVVLMEERSDNGVANTFNLWRQAGLNEGQKIAFYLNVIRQSIIRLEERIKEPLGGVTVIISGMASSSIGMVNIPYAEAPVPVDGSGVNTAFINANADFDHDVLIISGIRTTADVMRGEEAQLIGCIDSVARPVSNELYIFPGTHAKHIRVINNQITDSKTYMTGEFFELLTTGSILKTAVNKPDISKGDQSLPGFEQGVNDAAAGNLLHAAFNVRINQLFHKSTNEENFNYLSGLLIGTELKDLKTSKANTIHLICGPGLELYYRTALRLLKIKNVNDNFQPGWVDEAAVRGQYKIGRHLNLLT